jgi:hypothetical protein
MNTSIASFQSHLDKFIRRPTNSDPL